MEDNKPFDQTTELNYLGAISSVGCSDAETKERVMKANIITAWVMHKLQQHISSACENL